MAIYRTTFPVAASAERVWEVIGDFDNWSQWNPSVPSIKGELLVGSTCAVKLVMPGRPSINVKSSGRSGDDLVGRALRAIEEQPEHPWTVESLATRVGLSRAALARRFALQMGEPPLTYLTRWRLALAADLLVSTDHTLAAIASEGRVRERVRPQRGFNAGQRRVATGLPKPPRPPADAVKVLWISRQSPTCGSAGR